MKKEKTWPPDKSKTANLPSEMAFKPIFHHLSLSSMVLSSTVDTLLSGTGSIAATGSPAISTNFASFHIKLIIFSTCVHYNKAIKKEMNK